MFWINLKWINKILIILPIFVAEPVFAQLDITNVFGNLVYGGSLTIMGTGFGIKSPAAPLVWNDGMSNPTLSTYYDGYLPTNAQQGSYYNMAYRSVPFRGLNGPNSRISYILGGAHATNSQADSYSVGGNVGLGKNIASHSYFINYYYRVDPFFDEENHPTYSDNMKEIVLSNTQGSFYPDGWGAFGYADWCNSHVPDVNQRGAIKLGRMTIDPAHQSVPYGCSGNNLVYHNNPINGWIKMQWEGVYNHQYDAPQYSLTTYPDGQKTFRSHYGDGLTVTETFRGPWAGYPKENDLKFIGIGGFARVPRMNNGLNSFRYFAAVYMDNTRARVMLGDKQDYSACTIMEPQIPSVWSDNSITVSVNLGGLPASGTAYLYVFDANNNGNVIGYPIALGGGTNSSPAPPTGLRISGSFLD